MKKKKKQTKPEEQKVTHTRVKRTAKGDIEERGEWRGKRILGGLWLLGFSSSSSSSHKRRPSCHTEGTLQTSATHIHTYTLTHTNTSTHTSTHTVKPIVHSTYLNLVLGFASSSSSSSCKRIKYENYALVCALHTHTHSELAVMMMAMMIIITMWVELVGSAGWMMKNV